MLQANQPFVTMKVGGFSAVERVILQKRQQPASFLLRIEIKPIKVR
ncbi:MAG TPA: hypothetical protein PKJ36_06495 [Flavihumibacter sp.]|nr:hypothetical protein [Flavihumibacter sp.]